MQSFIARRTFTSPASSPLKKSAWPIVGIAPLGLRNQPWRGQIRTLSNPPEPTLVKAVRELAAAAKLKCKLEKRENLKWFMLNASDAPTFFEMLGQEIEKKNPHSCWRLKCATTFRSFHQELWAILEADEERTRPLWTQEERESCRQWLKDCAPAMEKGLKILD